MPQFQTAFRSILLIALQPILAYAQPHPDRDRLASAWHLISLEQPGPGNQLHRVDATGMFVFTADGHLAVQVMDRDPQPQTPESPHRYSTDGYEASYGTYTIDEEAHIFTIHVEGALVRSLIGKDLPRRYKFSGNQLTITSTRPDEHWRAVWQRD
jgi:Lipocalin-like domain